MSEECNIETQEHLIFDNKKYEKTKSSIELQTQKVTFFGIL